MNKIISAKLAILVTSFLTASVFAATGTITIQGEITDNSCTVPAGEMTRTIPLAKITPGYLDLSDDGEEITSEAFNFNFYNCPFSVSDVGVKFTYTSDNNNANYLANTGIGRGVSFAITDERGALIANNDVIRATGYSNGDGAGSISAKVKAFRNADDVAEGNISSVANVELVTY